MKAQSKLSLRKKADKYFSLYIRLRDRDSMGETNCYTCKWKGSYKKAQCGHFVPRQYLATRYDEVNNHAQCYACNMLYNGQPSAYAKRLREDYDEDIVELLEGSRKEVIPNFDYQYVIDIYKEKVRKFGVFL